MNASSQQEASLGHDIIVGASADGLEALADLVRRLPAAHSYGARVLGVVLTGTLDNGTAGLQVIKMRGGLALVHDPEEALFASLPHNAMDNIAMDFVQPVAGLAETLMRLTREPVVTRGAALLPRQSQPDQLEPVAPAFREGNIK